MNAKQPKRPLSAYNLYYRFKRSKILDATESGAISTETITRLVLTHPGLETYPSISDTMSPTHVQWLRRTEIRSAMLNNLSPKDTRSRTHQKTHGAMAMSFLTMSKLMCDGWRSIDGFGRSVFEELAEEGRRMYKKRVAEIEELELCQKKKKAKPSTSVVTFNEPQVKEHHEDKKLKKVINAKGGVLSGPKVKNEANKHAPKRPLSAYNLFYKYKRMKLLEAHKNGIDSTESINQLIAATPGLEGYLSVANTLSPDEEMKLLRNEIRSTLKGNLFPKDVKTRTRYPHHAAFANSADMTKRMSGLWKSIDGYCKLVFEELAKEGRKMYKERVAEYKSKSTNITMNTIKAPELSNAALEGTQPEVCRSITPTDLANDIPEERRKSYHQVLSSATPNSLNGPDRCTLDNFPLSPNVDLEEISYIINDPDPISADIFDPPEDRVTVDSASDFSNSAVSTDTQYPFGNNSDDFLDPPFSSAHEKDEPVSKMIEQEALLRDDFMEFVETTV